VNVNVALREWGLLTVGGAGAVTKSAGVRKLARRAKKALPKSVWKRAKAAAQGSIDWSRTKAFSAPIPQQGVYVNLKGREPHGIVSQHHYDDVRNDVIVGFEHLVDPHDGGNITDHVHRREDVVWGPEAERAPDLFPVCRGYSFELSDGLYSPGILDDYRAQPRGFHQMDGIFGVAGPGIDATEGLVARIYDIAPTALYLAGLKIPEMDGRVIPEALSSGRPAVTEPMDLPLAGEGSSAAAYSPEEEAQIEESLRNLGYL
jgi:predicted AlkP superfamily phosphohydrolase/phosphomutase